MSRNVKFLKWLKINKKKLKKIIYQVKITNEIKILK